MTKGPTQDNSFFRTVPGAAQCHKRLSHGLVAARPKLPKAEKMKIAICIAAAVSAVTVGRALAQPVSLHYPDIVREARRIEKLEGGEYVISNKVLFHRARLNLRAFGKGSDAFYVDKKDEISFTCAKKSAGFTGGVVEALVVKHEPGAEGSHDYTLDNCRAAK